jgi:lysine biosynthesis protein LysW
MYVYSEKTRCPVCQARVNLEQVRLLQPFVCPICGAELQVVDGYLRTLRIISFVLAWLLPLAFGVRNVLLLFILSVPLYGVMLALLVYLVKHFFPPRLVRHSRSDGSMLGLRDPDTDNRRPQHTSGGAK